jgi:hypothetical protein
MCRYFLGNKCDKMWNKCRNMRKDVKYEKMEAAERNKIPQL